MVDTILEKMDIPNGQPEWLGLLDSLRRAIENFPDGVKTYSYRMMGIERPTWIRWGINSLTMKFGRQITTWQIDRDGWHGDCTCGFATPGRCPHTYAAAKLFDELAVRKNWKNRAPILTKATKNGKLKPLKGMNPISSEITLAQRYSKEIISRGAGANKSLFDVNSQKPKKLRRLTVEVDFKHNPGYATLRFYEEGQRKNIIRIQSLYNYSRYVRRDTTMSSDWLPDDANFMAWIYPHLTKAAEIKHNLQVLKLTRKEFDRWYEEWKDEPGRFIEKHSQKPYIRDSKPDFRVFMNPVGAENVELAATIIFPSGEQMLFHEFIDVRTNGDKTGRYPDCNNIEINFPLSKELLAEAFSKKSPRMRRAHVVKHLPAVLEGKLELLDGPMIRKVHREGKVRLSIRTDGGWFVFRTEIDGIPVSPKTNSAAAEIESDGTRFNVVTYGSTMIRYVQKLLENLNAEINPNGESRIRESIENATKLSRELDQLDKQVFVQLAPELRGLMDKGLGLKAEIAVSTNNSFAEIDVLWQSESGVFAGDEIKMMLQKGSGLFRNSSGSWLRIDENALGEAAGVIADLDLFRGGRTLLPAARQTLKKLRDSNLATVKPRAEKRDIEFLDKDFCPPKLPEFLNSVLRDYQKEGVIFLTERAEFGVGGILADDMGLGKTLQVLAFLESFRQRDDGKLRALVVCPASVVPIWLGEAEKFCPDIKCGDYTGLKEQRAQLLEENADWQVLVTNYALLRNDIDELMNIDFDFVILDEAQFIKNPDAQVTRAVCSLKCRAGFALSGTPLENKLLDVWSIMEFCNPGYLGDRELFTGATNGALARGVVSARLRPAVLRRRKSQVATELPPVTREVVVVDMNENQAQIYQKQLVSARELLRQKGPMEILASLTRLRQICCDPVLLNKSMANIGSAKLDFLLEQISILVEEGHSALVFSQFKSMLDVIQPKIEALKIPVFKITGDTPQPERKRLVQEFQNTKESQIFLLSLKAAGTGLTLTKADYVFIFDPWWNPAAERQAIDRTHRIGQDSPVIAYRLICRGTVEEKVLAMQEEKAALFDEVVEGVPQAVSRLTAEDLAMLLAD